MINTDFSYAMAHKDLDVVVYVDDYSYTPGCPETGPSYSSGGEPAEPAEVEIISGYVELDFTNGSFKRLFDDNANATTTLFDTLVEREVEDIESELESYIEAEAEEYAMELALSYRD